MAILDNFDAIKDKATEAASTAVKKTKQIALISKANIAILSLEDKIRKAYRELGKLYYRDYAVDEEHDTAEYLPWCLRIDESKQAIADLRDYIEALKNGDDMPVTEEVAEDFEIDQ